MTTIDLADAGVYIEKMGPEIREKAIAGVRLAVVHGLQTIQVILIPSRIPQPVDRGIYRAAWKVVSIPDGAEIYNDSPIAALIEFGVRAGNIKIGRKLLEALAQWVIRKRLVKIKHSKKQPSIWDAAMTMAWAIAKHAKASGKGFHNQKPGGGLRIMEELTQKFLPGYIKESVERELER